MIDAYSLIRPLLFRLDAEKAHELALKALSYLPYYPISPAQSSAQTIMGIPFLHTIGLAAGLDKNGEYLDALSKLGFSFIEIGTITPKPQEGNPKPRLFRVSRAQAIINRMGFNNKGVDALVANVRKAQYQGVLGINIGKNKDTSLNDAVNDYVYCLKKVYEHASYITINISSPNTPDLRQLQQKDYLHTLLQTLSEEQQRLSEDYQRLVPLVVKLSPDEDDDSLKRMADIIINTGMSGIIATNTTCSRDAINGLPHAHEAGGLSGKPLLARSTECLCLLKSIVGSEIALIGVGGIDSVESALQKQQAGASLLQVYSGLIYQGPQLIRRLVRGLGG